MSARPPPDSLPIAEVRHDQLIELVRRYGRSSTSFLSLYGGFRFFGGDEPVAGKPPSAKDASPPGLIAYVDTGSAWVAAGEPLAPPDRAGLLIERFLSGARAARRQAILLPVSEEIRRIAESRGFRAYPIGMEPWHRLAADSETRAGWLKKFNSAKLLLGRGARVEPFNPLRIPHQDNVELETLTQRWLASRKAAPLGFLNRVEPWKLSEHKRYFWLRHQGILLGYVAAIPIWSRGGWYLIDLIRDPSSPPGTTELLVIEACEYLGRQGATEITLGLSPLANASEPPGESSIYSRVSRHIFEKGNLLYNFKPLYEYKEKFDPTHWETMYLLSSNGLGPRALLSLFRALYPEGLLHASIQSLKILRGRIRISPYLLDQITPRILVRSMPGSWPELLLRCRAVLILAAVNILFFLETTNIDHIRPSIVRHYAYTWARLPAEGLTLESAKAVLLCSFLHWDLGHLGFNLLVLFVFGGFLELIAGSTLLSLSYAVGILFSNLLTSLAGIVSLRFINPDVYQRFITEPDIGCSLGVFACVGTLSHFTRSPGPFLAAWTVGVVAYSAKSGHIMDLNHLMALLLGYLLARKYVESI